MKYKKIEIINSSGQPTPSYFFLIVNIWVVTQQFITCSLKSTQNLVQKIITVVHLEIRKALKLTMLIKDRNAIYEISVNVFFHKLKIIETKNYLR